MSDKNQNETYNPWSVEYNDYDAQKEKSRESLLTIGNGYFGTRGALEESTACETNYPGTYIAGLYNRLISKMADRDIENEDFVNVPNWQYLNFRINGADWFNINNSTVISIRRELDFKNGTLVKQLTVKDNLGRETEIKSSKFASMANRHLAAIQYTIRPLNYSGKIDISSKLDGTVINDGVARYRDLNHRHLESVSQGNEDNINWLRVKTTQSNIEIAEASKHTFYKNGELENVSPHIQYTEGVVESGFSVALQANETVTIEKVVAISSSKNDDVKEPIELSKHLVETAGSFKSILEESEKAWEKIWKKIDIQIEGDVKSQMLMRLHLYHLMVTASPNNVTIDAGIPARGLHGEAYRGHIFWDELYILPVYNLFFPEVAKSILNYRYRRLDKAREYAKEHGYQGSMFPWQSGSDGSEETQTIHLNPISGKWGDDYSSLQRHISIAVAYNTWYYFQVSNDVEFMQNSGAEMFLEICRFWASKAVLDEKIRRFSISKVMGPDEFHEEHKASKGGGVKDNAYTNIMVAWLFSKAAEMFDKLSENSQTEITSKINLQANEIKKWELIGNKLNIPVSEDGIIEQFEGYFNLKELDWDAYRKKYKNIYRLDRILKAEGKSPDDYKLAKQADTLMTFYNLDEEVITTILEKSGAKMPSDYLKKNYDYYLARTSHGSTLSRVVHSYLASLFGDNEQGCELYFDALQSDFTDIQGGTTAEGIHAGVMGGTVLMAITSYAGINLKKEILSINPALPKNWKALKFNITFKGHDYYLNLKHNQINIEIKSDNSASVGLMFSNKKILLRPNKQHVLDY